MAQRELFDAQRAHIEPPPPGKKGGRDQTAEGNPQLAEALLWLMRNGASWRDLPKKFGNWKRIREHFHQSVGPGKWAPIIKEFSEVVDGMTAQSISDAERTFTEIFGPDKKRDGGGTAKDKRQLLEELFWWMRTDASLRDLPKKIGNWKAIRGHFRRWSKRRIFAFIRKELRKTVGSVYAMLGGVIVQSDPRIRANMKRLQISDEHWELIKHLPPGKKGDRGGTAKDNRLFLEAILWRMRTGAPWRDIPEKFGDWNSIHKRFRRWVKSGVFKRIREALRGEIDFECAMIDGTIVKVHRKAHGAGEAHGEQAIGRSRGGWTTKILLLVDAKNRPIDFNILPGQAGELTGIKDLIKDTPFHALIADKGYDADWLPDDLAEREIKAVIPPRSNRKVLRDYDKEMYKMRHLIENFFARIKEYRAIATRYDKTDTSYAAFWDLATMMINHKSNVHTP